MSRLPRTTALVLAALVAVPAITGAQGASTPQDTLFLRAQRLVNEGDGDAGRRLVDSLYEAAFAATPPDGARRAEALYWRAALAATAAEAERDYMRLVVEYPLSSYAEEALITLAQLELTRRDYAQAIRHLEQLIREHPSSGSVPRAQFWIARVHIEQGNLPRGCASLASARAKAPPTNIELHNQIDFLGRRCAGVDTAGIAAADASAATPPLETPPPSFPPRRDSTPPAQQRTAPAAGTVQYTVQVAAMNTRAQAEELRRTLAERGYEARVVGAGRLFRVRIGRYPTREAAAAVAAELRRRGISRDAWVAEAEAR